MLTRRRFLGYSALTPAIMAYRRLLGSVGAPIVRDPSRPVVRLAVLGNVLISARHCRRSQIAFLWAIPGTATGMCRMCR